MTTIESSCIDIPVQLSPIKMDMSSYDGQEVLTAELYAASNARSQRSPSSPHVFDEENGQDHDQPPADSSDHHHEPQPESQLLQPHLIMLSEQVTQLKQEVQDLKRIVSNHVNRVSRADP